MSIAAKTLSKILLPFCLARCSSKQNHNTIAAKRRRPTKSITYRITALRALTRQATANANEMKHPIVQIKNRFGCLMPLEKTMGERNKMFRKGMVIKTPATG